MERAGLWEEFGEQGWSTGGNDNVSIVDYGPKSHSSTGDSRGGAYRNDYILFVMSGSL